MAARGRRIHSVACSLLVLSVNLCCSSEDGRYRKNVRDTIVNAKQISWVWKVVKLRELYPNGSIIKERQKSLIENIKLNGIDWSIDGKDVSFGEVVAGADEEALRDLSLLDGWGQPYEFKIVEGHVVIRSSGSDRVFDGSKYQYGTFPWLSGGDFVIIGDGEVRWTVPPKAYDWLEDGS